MLRIMPIMLNYATSNYALCSDSAIMPKSNAGIIGLAQARAELHRPSSQAPVKSRVSQCCVQAADRTSIYSALYFVE